MATERVAADLTAVKPAKKKATRAQAGGAWTCACTLCGHLPSSDGNAVKHTTTTLGHNVYEQTFDDEGGQEWAG